jgi:hypothetical protein
MAALQVSVQGIFDVFPSAVVVDGGDFEGWIDLGDGVSHSANILSGKFTPTIDGGPLSEWEGIRDATIAYATIGVDKDARAARRDLAVPAVEAMLAADRTLGSGDPQVWAEIGETSEDDDTPLVDSGNASVALIGINILYVAASAAG